MSKNLVPYGLLPAGNYGINLDNTTGEPIAAALEVMDTLPPVADPDNFPGRLVFSKADSTAFIYITLPAAAWVALEGIPATVGNSVGAPTFLPPVTGSEQAGEIFWTLDTQVLFVWDGFVWQPAGGRFATTVIEQRHVGTGAQTVFSLGVSTAVPTEHVEIFIDGIRQNSLNIEPVTGDYTVAGTNVVFTAPPVFGAEIITRSLESVQISQTAQVFERVVTAGVGQTNFATGVSGTQPEALLVFIDGVAQSLAAGDFTLQQADTTLATFSKALPGDITGNITVNGPHGITNPGTVITIDGTDQPVINGRAFVVNAASDFSLGSVTLIVDMLAGDPQFMLGNPIMFFSPPFFEDEVVFSPSPFVGTEIVHIKAFKSLVVAPSTGEANTTQIIPGATPGRQDITASKFGDILQFKGVAPGANVLVADNGTDLVISASTGANFEDRIGANGALLMPGDTTSYVGVLDSNLFAVVVDLVDVGPGAAPPTAGRKITIKDEGAGAGINNITIQDTNGNLFDDGVGGIPGGSFVMSNTRGSVTFVFDGINTWQMTARI